MPDFDIIGSSPYGGQPGGDGSGFDIIAPNAGGRPMPGQPGQPGQPGAMPAAAQPMGQPQGAPVSGLLAGILGLPTYGGATPGAAYLTPGQGQAYGGQPQQVNGLLAGMAGYPAGSLTGAAQSRQNIGAAVGSGARSLFDSLVNGGS